MAAAFLWVVVVGGVGSWLFGYATGANDVGNAFGTAVGAKSLTMLQAVIIAGIFEFVGAIILGRVSTNTIAGGIADVKEFKDNPTFYAYGMMWTLLMGGIWQLIACALGWNVSATHTIIGGIVGFAFVAKGPNGGIIPIVGSWFIAPVLAALASSTIFLTIRTLVLRHENARERSLYVLPPLVFFTVFINIFFILTKGAKKLMEQHHEWNDHKAAWISLVVATCCALFVAAAIPFVRRAANRQVEQRYKASRTLSKESSLGQEEGEEEEAVQMVENPHAPATSGSGRDVTMGNPDFYSSMARMVEEGKTPKDKGWGSKIKDSLTYGIRVDIHDIIDRDDKVKQIHADAEVFDPRAEQVFAYLQIFSAICVMFAHGAAEVGYMAGPLATIWSVYKHGKLSKKVEAPVWVVMFSAISLVIGLATYGYNITRAMGTQMAKITPARGFAAELSTALVILISSQWGLPNSSSQCITGGIIGIGMVEGVGGVNWKFFVQTFTSWVLTIVVMALGTGVLFAQGVWAPHANTC